MNLKTQRLVKGNVFAFLFGAITLASCSKDINTTAPAGNTQSLSALQSSEALISDTAAIKFFKAPFSSRGSRTDFRGEVSDTTAIISLDFLIQKKFEPGTQRRLLLDYADGALSKKGWQYEVIIDSRTGTIKLIPNDVMASQTVPGSFNVVAAVYDKFSASFTFMTEVKETSNNIVHQVTEILTRQ